MSKKLLISVLMMSVALSACTRTTNMGLKSDPAPTPITPAPAGQVQITDMSHQPNMTAPTAPTAPASSGGGQTQVASLPPAQGQAEPITKNGMAGAWAVPSDSGGCKILLAFTKWAGGYRAANRGCNTAEIKSVTAWDVKDQQVVLVDGNGNTVARLYSSGGGSYDGTTASGKPVSFRR